LLRKKAGGVLLTLLCIAALMIAVDGTVVTVALPSIKADLKFPEAGLVWVVDAYLLSFSGLMLLAGKLGDLIGHRALFLAGIAVFTLSSMFCALATSPEMLVLWRAVQGVGGAIVWVMSLTLIFSAFEANDERAKALGAFTFASVGGGSLALVLGGLLTGGLSWHWVFLINLPVGILVYVFGRTQIPRDKHGRSKERLDVAGAIAVTATLTFAVCAAQAWDSPLYLGLHSGGLLAISAALAVAFVAIEARTSEPLIPGRMMNYRDLWGGALVEMLATGAVYLWGFVNSLYLQRVLGFTPLAVGLALLPANVLSAALALGISNRVVSRFGSKRALTAGLVLGFIGIGFFVRMPVNASLLQDILPGSLLLAMGIGIVSTPLTMLAMNGVPSPISGLASGIVNTASIMGGALGLALGASIASVRARHLSGIDSPTTTALASGYHLAFLAGAALIAVAALISGTRDWGRAPSKSAQEAENLDSNAG
jgi:EmrB/QacA subfamily drug resistance transporter